MQKILLVLLSIVLSSSLLSQDTQQRNGYIITKDGLRKEGQIQAFNWKKHIKAINFTMSGLAKKEWYEMNDILAFGIGDRQYEKHLISYNSGSTNHRELGTSKDIQYATEYGFLQKLNDGERILYEYISPRGFQHYFLSDGEEKLEYLIYHKYINAENKVRENHGFRAQLQAALAECGTLGNRISMVDYDLKPLVNLIAEWHSCKGKAHRIINEPDSRKYKIGIGLMSSMQMTKSYIGERLRERTVVEPYQFELEPAFGLSFWLHRLKSKRTDFTLKLDVQYSFFNASLVEERVTNQLFKTVWELEVREELLSFSLAPVKQLTQGKNPLFLEFLLYYNIPVKGEYNTIETEVRSITNVVRSSTSYDTATRRGEIGYGFGLGTRIGNFHPTVRASYADRLGSNIRTRLRLGLAGQYYF